MTDILFLENMGIKIGDEITLLELDNKIEKMVNDEDITTTLESYGVDEILEWGKYPYYFDQSDSPVEYINFEVIKNTGDENSVIKILK